MVSEHGFQAGAEKVALTNGIQLYVLSATPGRRRLVRKNPGERFEGWLLNVAYMNAKTIDEALLAAIVDWASDASRLLLRRAAVSTMSPSQMNDPGVP
jgi:hypothetical protein